MEWSNSIVEAKSSIFLILGASFHAKGFHGSMENNTHVFDAFKLLNFKNL